MTVRYKTLPIFLSILTTGLVMIFIVLPTARRIKQLNEDIYTQRVMLEKLYLRGQSIKKSRQNYNKIKDQIKILENVFNRQGKELEFITSLEKIAEKQNIKQIINIKKAKNGDDTSASYKILEVELTLNGTFPEILAYLDEVQSLDYYFNIDYLNFYYPQAKLFGKTDIFESLLKELKKSQISPKINAKISGLTYWK